MTVFESGERTRLRYATVLYWSALLRDPSPPRAGRAVVAALRSMTWNAGRLDDQFEAELIARLPPPPRLQLPHRRLAGDWPSGFWQLSSAARLALGLRLLRGMPTPMIAKALRLPLADLQTLIVDAGRTLGGDTTLLSEACRAAWAVRLDAPTTEHTHLLTCRACQIRVPHWERAERTLADQLGRTIGSHTLPAAVHQALSRGLDTGRQGRATSLGHRPAALQAAIVLCVLFGLFALIWPPSSTKLSAPRTGTLSPAALMAAARAAYFTVPHVDGILHRRWSINLGQPQLNFDAHEWVDPRQPGRHRMQLVADRTTAEWEVGDGQDHLLYMSNLVPYFCGASASGVQSHTNERNSWRMSPVEQAAMRMARWQHGAWATGLHYLDLAAQADTVRLFGGAGGASATLALSAKGHTINGTLLLRFDPLTYTLLEVNELRLNNGQTEDHVPWQLLSSETLTDQPVQQHDLLTAYPGNAIPPLVDRSMPVIDRGCPLAGSEQMKSPRQLLTMPSMNSLIGLPNLPPGIAQAMIIGPDDPTAPRGFSQTFRFQPSLNSLQIVYVGPAKRLILLLEAPPLQRDTSVHGGPWHVQFFPQEVPTVLTAVLQRADIPNLQVFGGRDRGNYARVLAEGWTRKELLTILASARPLSVDDLARAPDHFYEPARIAAAGR